MAFSGGNDEARIIEQEADRLRRTRPALDAVREAIARAKALGAGYSGGPSAEVAVREMRDKR